MQENKLICWPLFHGSQVQENKLICWPLFHGSSQTNLQTRSPQIWTKSERNPKSGQHTIQRLVNHYRSHRHPRNKETLSTVCIRDPHTNRLFCICGDSFECWFTTVVGANISRNLPLKSICDKTHYIILLHWTIQTKWVQCHHFESWLPNETLNPVYILYTHTIQHLVKHHPRHPQNKE